MDGKSVPYIVFEGEMARNERHIRRLWILVIILAVMLVGTNIGWLIYEAQFMDKVVTVESQTDGGGTAIANASGEVSIYGESESNGQAEKP